MRITKTMAHEVAIKLTEKKKEEVKVLKEALEDEMFSLGLSKCPQDVIDLFKKRPAFFNTSSYIQLSGSGFDYERFNSKEEFPSDASNRSIDPGKTLGKKLRMLADKIEEKDEAYRALKLEIENTLFSLRTSDNIKKVFPEAFAFLPAEKATKALTVCIDSIRKKL